MENLKNIPEFNEGVEDVKNALNSIEQAKKHFLEARNIAINKLRCKKENILERLKNAKKEKSDLENAFVADCKQIGHCFEFVSKKFVRQPLRHPYELGHLYDVTYRCKCCGETRIYRSKIVGKDMDFTEEHLNLLNNYTKKITAISSKISKIKKELSLVNKQLEQICTIFGHERDKEYIKYGESYSDSYSVIKCKCCGKEIKSNDFRNCDLIFTHSCLSDLIRFSEY